jgi:methylase of polypeptide subunit release factors
LEPEVRDHEPQTALVPPDGNGYAIYQRLVDQAARRLPSPAALVLELGAGMAAEVSRLCLVAGLAPDPPLADLQGHARVLISRPSPRFGADPAAR